MAEKMSFLNEKSEDELVDLNQFSSHEETDSPFTAYEEQKPSHGFKSL